ncbi:MAG: DUF1491 family protein [Alphaproteobacteria bacterium]|nr:DUF1491 family protein [Alphaproteobacteria bacterium]
MEDLIIAAQIRLAAKEGVPITVVHRGDNSRGSVFLKINLLDGTARVLAQARLGEEVGWNPIGRADTMPETDADRYLARQIGNDPDCWVLEIEDRQGRLWFPGRVLKDS